MKLTEVAQKQFDISTVKDMFPGSYEKFIKKLSADNALMYHGMPLDEAIDKFKEAIDDHIKTNGVTVKISATPPSFWWVDGEDEYENSSPDDIEVDAVIESASFNSLAYAPGPDTFLMACDGEFDENVLEDVCTDYFEKETDGKWHLTGDARVEREAFKRLKAEGPALLIYECTIVDGEPSVSLELSTGATLSAKTVLANSRMYEKVKLIWL